MSSVVETRRKSEISKLKSRVSICERRLDTFKGLVQALEERLSALEGNIVHTPPVLEEVHIPAALEEVQDAEEVDEMREEGE